MGGSIREPKAEVFNEETEDALDRLHESESGSLRTDTLCGVLTHHGTGGIHNVADGSYVQP